MRKLVLLLFLIFSFSLFAQEAEIENLHFIPPDYYVGDYVELYFTLVTDKVYQLDVPALLPGADWIEIRDVDIEQNGLETQVRISFVSFYPGTRTLMPISLGDITIREIKLFTRSLKDEGYSELAPLAAQLDLPATRLVIALLIISLLVIPVLLYFVIRFSVGAIELSLVRYRERAPYRALRRLLKQLSAVDHSYSNKDFYLELTEGIRKYLSKRFKRDYMTATTKEMKLPPEEKIAIEIWDSLLKVLNKGDLVKFAGEKASYIDKLDSLTAIENIARTLEELR